MFGRRSEEFNNGKGEARGLPKGARGEAITGGERKEEFRPIGPRGREGAQIYNGKILWPRGEKRRRC